MKSTPPLPPQRPVDVTVHGDSRKDDFAWLQDRNSQEVLDYLEEENSYTASILGEYASFEEILYEEMKSRIQETDESVPEKIDNFYYYSRTEEGKQYGIFCRKEGSLNNKEEVYLDENILAEGHEFYDVGTVNISPDHKMVAYGFDIDGDEIYTIKIKDLATGQLLNDTIIGAAPSIEWSEDSKSLYYVTLDDAHRPYKVFKHILGNEQKLDKLVFHEKDDSFGVDISKSRSREMLFIESSSHASSECRWMKTNSDSLDLNLIMKREKDVEYFVDHRGDHFYIMTNQNAINFKLIRCPIDDVNNYSTLLEHDENVTIEGFDLFDSFMSIYKRGNGIDSISFHLFASGDWHTLSFEEEVYTLNPQSNPEFNTTKFRYSYSSLSTPEKIYDFDPFEQSMELLKTQPVPGGFDESKYECKRIWATADDQVKVPVSILYRKDLDRTKPNPFYLYGYGAYGHVIEPAFSSNIFSLIDRGMIYGIAHIRGGAFLGRKWYENGKKLFKKNTFTDFLACAEHIIEEGLTTPDQLVIRGGSAGGLLMGNVIQLRPDLFHAAIADVPFVDIINTMLDETLPLTIPEYDEWGNPKELEYYQYMLSYSPYDMKRKDEALPHLLVTAGLNDPRVQYWEPAKWVASMRHEGQPNLLFLRTNMGAGHMGMSGRYDYLKEIAFRFSFLLNSLKIPRNKDLRKI